MSLLPLEGRRVIVTAGPTHEPIDPVRYLANRSSGLMGFAIAEAAADAGASVLLIAGPTVLPTPPGVARVDIVTACDMQHEVQRGLGADGFGADAVIMAAAVADFRPKHLHETKWKKQDAPGDDSYVLELVRNPDILRELGEARASRGAILPVLVGFALETGDDDAVYLYAAKKLVSKQADMIVANAAHESLGLPESRIAIIDAAAQGPRFSSATKAAHAKEIVAKVGALLAERS